MNKQQKGAYQAVHKCMKVKPSEKVVVICDNSNKSAMKYIFEEAKKVTKKVEFFNLDDYGKRPLRTVPKVIKKSLKDCDVSYLALTMASNKRFNERNTIRKPVRDVVLKRGGRHAGMPGFNRKIMEQGLNADYDKIEKMSLKVYNLVKKAKTITVTTAKGTKLKAEFSKKIKWIPSYGKFKKGNWGNLPSGEVFTHPININGTAVIDGVLGDWFIKLGKLKQPVKVTIVNGKTFSILCKNKKLERDLRKAVFKADKNSSRIGEFAIGTNIALKGFIGNMLQDEKVPGVHIAFGDPYPGKTGAKYSSKLHLDGVITKTDIFVDGKQIMKKGKFLI